MSELEIERVNYRGCSYCEKRGEVAVHGARGNTIHACEQHLDKAVDANLVPPQVFLIGTGEQITIKVNWFME